MNTKLTLSLPAEVVTKAKRYVRRHGTSVSALLAKTIRELPEEDPRVREILKREPRWTKFSSLLKSVKPFDERSARILRKYG